jgi:hypothetical protein
MTFNILIASIIKTGALTILAEIAMKAIEQKDYARLIKFTGISGISVDIVAWIKELEKNPPLLLKLTQESFKGWKDFIKFMSDLF